MVARADRNGRPSVRVLEAERAVIGALLLSPEQISHVELSVGDFYAPEHAQLFQAIVATHADSGQVDPVVVLGYLPADSRIGHIDLVDLAGGIQSAAGLHHHAAIVREASRARRLAAFGRDLAARVADGADVDELLGESSRRLEELGEDGTRRGLETMGLGALLALPPPSWILDGLLPEAGLVVLAAEPKVGKSLLAQDWAMRMVHGVDRWHERRLTPGPVLYLAGEGMRSLKARAGAWIAAHPSESAQHPLAVARLPVLSSAQGLAELEATIAAHRPVLVIVDTLNLALGDVDENDAGQVGPIMSALSRLREKCGCTIILIHHLNKSEPGRPLLQRVRGSGAIVAAVDAIIGLAKDSDGVIRIETIMRDAESGKLPVRLEVVPIGLEDGTVGVHLVAAGADPTPDPVDQEKAAQDEHREAAEKRVLLAVQVLRDELDGQTSRKETIATRMGGKLTLARAAVNTAVDRKLILKEGTMREPIYRVPGVPGVCATQSLALKDGDGDDDVPSVPSTIVPGLRDDEGRRGTMGTTRDDEGEVCGDE